MSSKGNHAPMVWIVWALVAVLTLLHQDFWYWDDRTLVFGVLPVGLFYHASFSVACGVLWFLAVKFAWPRHLEEWAEGGEADGGGRAAGR